jgi:hypothetical protein
MEAPPRRIAPTEAPQETLSSEPAPAPPTPTPCLSGRAAQNALLAERQPEIDEESSFSGLLRC